MFQKRIRVQYQRNQFTFAIQKREVYDFICSFPGHWGTMQGLIVVID
ncbi:plastocyanin/azurin family copper-binding protein [Sphingobacterium sp. JB170]|nr:hypothetical protein FM107_10845 [Sphingobacterium sp. JB170]